MRKRERDRTMERLGLGASGSKPKRRGRKGLAVGLRRPDVRETGSKSDLPVRWHGRRERRVALRTSVAGAQSHNTGQQGRLELGLGSRLQLFYV